MRVAGGAPVSLQQVPARDLALAGKKNPNPNPNPNPHPHPNPNQDFLNAVCTNTVWLNRSVLTYYSGNYDTFCKLVSNQEQVQMREYEKQQADMEKLATFVRVNKANGVAASAKSKKKVLEKLEDDAVEKPKLREPSLVFSFPECSKLAPPVLPFDGVSFAYSGKKEDFLYEGLNLAVDYDSRVALVGPNGCGKSTLLKLMSGELHPTEGSVKKHQHLALGLYHQHSAEVLDLDSSPLVFMRRTFPPPQFKRSEEMWRSYLATFGFTTKQQTSPIGLMSDGQRSRLVFAMLAMQTSGVLLLDEPTNHLDLDAVDGLAAAIKAFQGGVVLVSHDFRLIDQVASPLTPNPNPTPDPNPTPIPNDSRLIEQVAKEIWVCEKKGVRKYDGSIHDYKRELAKKMGAYKTL